MLFTPLCIDKLDSICTMQIAGLCQFFFKRTEFTAPVPGTLGPAVPFKFPQGLKELSYRSVQFPLPIPSFVYASATAMDTAAQQK